MPDKNKRHEMLVACNDVMKQWVLTTVLHNLNILWFHRIRSYLSISHVHFGICVASNNIVHCFLPRFWSMINWVRRQTKLFVYNGRNKKQGFYNICFIWMPESIVVFTILTLVNHLSDTELHFSMSLFKL